MAPIAKNKKKDKQLAADELGEDLNEIFGIPTDITQPDEQDEKQGDSPSPLEQIEKGVEGLAKNIIDDPDAVIARGEKHGFFGSITNLFCHPFTMESWAKVGGSFLEMIIIPEEPKPPVDKPQEKATAKAAPPKTDAAPQEQKDVKQPELVKHEIVSHTHEG